MFFIFIFRINKIANPINDTGTARIHRLKAILSPVLIFEVIIDFIDVSLLFKDVSSLFKGISSLFKLDLLFSSLLFVFSSTNLSKASFNVFSAAST